MQASKAPQVPKVKVRPAKPKAVAETALHNKSVISSILAKKAKLSKEVKLQKNSGKAKPKPKAGVKIKDPKEEKKNVLILEESDSVVESSAKVTKTTNTRKQFVVIPYISSREREERTKFEGN